MAFTPEQHEMLMEFAEREAKLTCDRMFPVRDERWQEKYDQLRWRNYRVLTSPTP